jgi:hypothetical protein
MEGKHDEAAVIGDWLLKGYIIRKHGKNKTQNC